jgi:hypothetical protein
MAISSGNGINDFFDHLVWHLPASERLRILEMLRLTGIEDLKH